MPIEFVLEDLTGDTPEDRLRRIEDQLRALYRNPSSDKGVIADLEGQHAVAKGEFEAVAQPPAPPTDEELKEAFKETRLEDERIRKARDLAEKELIEEELIEEGKIEPPKLAAPVEAMIEAMIEAKVEATLFAMVEQAKADGGQDE